MASSFRVVGRRRLGADDRRHPRHASAAGRRWVGGPRAPWMDTEAA